MRIHFKILAYLFAVLAVSSAHAGSYEDFFRAIVRDDPGAVRSLLQRGFDPDTVDPNGNNGLFLAVKDGSFKAADALADWPKTNVEWRSPKGETALMIAALKGNFDLCHKLIDRGADVNQTGWTPLHYAATGGQVKIIELLLDESAYIDAESPNKSTPLMMAAMYGSEDAVKALLDGGADPTLRNQLGMTAVDFALRADRREVADLISAAIRARAPKGKW